MDQPIPWCVAHVFYLTTCRLHQRHPEGLPSSGPEDKRRWFPPEGINKSSLKDNWIPWKWNIYPFPTLGKTVNHDLEVNTREHPFASNHLTLGDWGFTIQYDICALICVHSPNTSLNNIENKVMINVIYVPYKWNNYKWVTWCFHHHLPTSGELFSV